MTVQVLADAEAVWAVAARINVGATILSPENAGAIHGVGWFEAIRRAIRAAQDKTADPRPELRWVMDCGDGAGHAAMALAAGFDGVVFRGDALARGRLEALAASLGLALLGRRPPSLALRPGPKLEQAVADWLSAG